MLGFGVAGYLGWRIAERDGAGAAISAMLGFILGAAIWLGLLGPRLLP
jgi:uncharacterized membrane protein